MQLTPVESTALDAIGWHKEIGLVVRFNGGHIWAYDDDDHAIYDAIMASPSKGKAFDRLVKKRNVRGVEIAEAELLSIDDDNPHRAPRTTKGNNPLAYLRDRKSVV